ncbi:hypothetical protein EVAR_3742_1 [Eumeta japonica]|uniref:Uncharacterized protein n=1 Tax=Eumeta variegata TaxID=151549 RepID=A0A4C1SUW2_EUMVA|nr:hypothetical protein EVAR_3742_1 [Eumeta japonica]
MKSTAVTQCKDRFEFGHAKAHCVNDPMSVNDVRARLTSARAGLQPGHNARRALCSLFRNGIKKRKEERFKFSENIVLSYTNTPITAQTSHYTDPKISHANADKNNIKSSPFKEQQTPMQRMEK